MSEKYKIDDPEGKYFVTLTVVHWIDIFTRKELKHVILDSLKYCQQNKGLIIHGWVDLLLCVAFHLVPKKIWYLEIHLKELVRISVEEYKWNQGKEEVEKVIF